MLQREVHATLQMSLPVNPSLPQILAYFPVSPHQQPSGEGLPFSAHIFSSPSSKTNIMQVKTASTTESLEGFEHFRLHDNDDSFFAGNDSSFEISGLELLDYEDEDLERFLFEDGNDSVDYCSNLDKVLYKDDHVFELEFCSKLLKDGIEKSQPSANHKLGERASSQTTLLTFMTSVHHPVLSDRGHGLAPKPSNVTPNAESFLEEALKIVSRAE
jgi:hypothetical protein